MRITFVCAAADLSGGFRVIALYAKKLQDRGHEVVVVSRPRPSPTFRDRLRALYRRRRINGGGYGPTHLDGLSVPHHRIDRHRAITAVDVPDGDIVVATWWETAEWVEALPASKGAKVHLIQDYEIWGGDVDRVDATCRLQCSKITPARWVRDLLVDRFAQTDVTVIPNAVDHEGFNAPVREKQKAPTVGFVYTPFGAKGCDLIIEAIRIAREERPDLRVIAFGNATPGPALPLPEGAEYYDHAPEAGLKDIYARCDVWLFGSRKEGFGLPILEAMACRTPVIATPAGAAPELLAGGVGVLVPMESPRAMADAVLEIAAMTVAEWRELSDRAFASAQKHNWDAAADRFEATLISVTRGRKIQPA